MQLTLKELESRRARFCAAMESAYPNWDTAIIISKVNQYYFTGTMQDGMIIIKNDGSIKYFVRKSYDRAIDESPVKEIYQMQSYRDAAEIAGSDMGNTYFEAESVPCAVMQRIEKHFIMSCKKSLDVLVRTVRAVKSPYELKCMELSGSLHHKLLVEVVPSILKEGMSEAEFFGVFYNEALKLGYQGITRFYKYQTEVVTGQYGFGESSLYPTSFDGPGGMLGNNAAAPVLGSFARKLKKGDLVFVDLGFGINGYHSDKTQVYMFGGKPSSEVVAAHRFCMDIQRRAAEKLKPGAVPSQIYNEILADISGDGLINFMGYKDRVVKFLGHGVGLHVDEFPVIAGGFDLPLEENMTIALEPKKGMKGAGMVGVEDTYLVTPGGGRCLTGGGCDIIII